MSDADFQVTFYGVRGSIPTPMLSQEVSQKISSVLDRVTPEDLATPESKKAFMDGLPFHVNGAVGGNSSCVHVRVGGHDIIFDGGSGIRVLGFDLAAREFGKGKGKAHLIFSHTHWDHILGVPFCTPLYIPGNHFTVCGLHKDLENRLKGQQEFKYFPVPFEYFGATLDFVDFNGMDSYQIGDALITWKEMEHPGQSFSYRIDYKGRSLVFSTDSEYKQKTPEYLAPTVEFFRDADLIIFDSQYTLIECMNKADWGHSSTFIGIDLALKAGAKRMAFYHHEPTYSDAKLFEIYESSKEFLEAVAPEAGLALLLAREGLTVDL